MLRTTRWIALGLALSLVQGCAASSELAALRHVDFAFDHISHPMVVGIPLSRISKYEDLTPSDLTRLGVAVASNDMPFDLTVHVAARHSKESTVSARLLAMDWTYLVDNKKVVEGKLSEALQMTIPPGEARDVPVKVTFNLVEAFEGAPEELIQTALVLSGQQPSGRKRTLEISPTLETPAGPMRFPNPIELDLSKPATPSSE
jgi:hypothetical protein